MKARRTLRALVQARHSNPKRRIVGTGHTADAYPQNEIASPAAPLHGHNINPERKPS